MCPFVNVLLHVLLIYGYGYCLLWTLRATGMSFNGTCFVILEYPVLVPFDAHILFFCKWLHISFGIGWLNKYFVDFPFPPINLSSVHSHANKVPCMTAHSISFHPHTHHFQRHPCSPYPAWPMKPFAKPTTYHTHHHSHPFYSYPLSHFSHPLIGPNQYKHNKHKESILFGWERTTNSLTSDLPFSILFFPKLYIKETTEMKLMVSESVRDSFTHYPWLAVVLITALKQK